MPIPASIPAKGVWSASGLRRGLTALAAAGLGRVVRWHELACQRRALLTLNDRMLKDIGISRAEAEREAGRPFWRDGIDPWR
ncbi:MAG TPA: DUF1127 domain-containing protein [Geminicoccaceae bacterium]|jgi:uncharacterized protein YjiS (DUF1127 family)|nr:DUF1127 domain-containing protein [Geminicoccaceae bacterium]HZA65930.1 DUF1127 domain-containing protein [Geminicoccaceae bacterium]